LHRVTQAVETTLPGLLRERASFQPDDTAYTFIDYERDWEGVPLTLTWFELYRQVQNVARELRSTASVGDRAMILAPQGLEYIVAFLGALEAGLIPAPLSVPFGGATDERVDSVLRDAVPTAVLTTSAVVDQVSRSLNPPSGQALPSVIEVDLLDLNAPVREFDEDDDIYDFDKTAYLQYTSGSTRSPAGVMVSYKNVVTNYQQIISDFMVDHGGVTPPDTTILSWLPFYHDLGMILGLCTPVLSGFNTVLSSPVWFLQRPARWMQLMASYPKVFTAAPNFAFDVAARKTTDADMAGRDLSDVLIIQSGGERVNSGVLKRFADRFARFNLRENVLLPVYGMAEATLYMAARWPDVPPRVVRFDSDALAVGEAKEAVGDGGTPLVSYGVSQPTAISPMMLVVDPETRKECPPGKTGEIWTRGDNVGLGYWEKPEETAQVFHATLVDPAPGLPEGPWLRTGDLGFFFDSELFIVGRIKDLLIIYGKNHAPDDIEATVHELSKGRVAAIAVPDGDGNDQLVVVLEVKKPGDTEDHVFAELKRDVTSAINSVHGIAVTDLVLVAPGSIPITTSGKIRRALSVEMYLQDAFVRVDA
jgi:fatty acid CoA ligase FadD28